MSNFKIIRDDAVIVYQFAASSNVIRMIGDGWREEGTFNPEAAGTTVPAPTDPKVLALASALKDFIGLSLPAAPPPAPLVTGLARPTSQEELRSMIQHACNNGGGISFDGSIVMPIAGTLTINVKDIGDFGPVLNFNGMRLVSTNTDGVTPCVRFIGNGKCLSINQLNIDGNRWGTPGCGNGLEVIASGGSLWRCKLRDIDVSYCNGNGIRLQGAFFESETYSLTAKDCWQNGCSIACMSGTSTDDGVISNLQMFGNNLSRNGQAGLSLENGANSVDLFGGSYITNGLCGINAPYGCRTIVAPNGENTGEVFINMPDSYYPSTIIGANLSSNGVTVVGNPNPGALPSRYVIKAPPRNFVMRDSYFTAYSRDGGVTPAPTNMALLAP